MFGVQVAETDLLEDLYKPGCGGFSSWFWFPVVRTEGR